MTYSSDPTKRPLARLAAQAFPVRLRGTITFFDQSQFFRFIQDETAGLYFFLDDAMNNQPLAAGQLVEIEGEANPGEYAPIVMPRKIRILGPVHFPLRS